MTCFTIAVTMAGTAVTTVGLNLFSSWLYDRLKSHPTIREFASIVGSRK
jgi:hypothetical protein